MENIKAENELIKQAGSVLEGKTGEKLEIPIDSPLEQAIKVNEETKKNLEELRKVSDEIARNAAQLMVGGRSIAGQKPKEMSQEEKNAEEIKRITSMMGR